MWGMNENNVLEDWTWEHYIEKLKINTEKLKVMETGKVKYNTGEILEHAKTSNI